MRLEFLLVVMVVSIFRYNKVFGNLREFCDDRFTGGCCGDQDFGTDQKSCSALLRLGRRGACGSSFSSLNSHVTVQEVKIVFGEVRYSATKNAPKKVLGFVFARQTRSVLFITVINK